VINILARQTRLIQLFFDSVFIGVAWFIAYSVRFRFFRSAQSGLEISFVGWFFPLLAITLYFLLKNGQYERQRLLSLTDDLMRLFRANALSLVTFIVVLYFVSEVRISRLTIVLYAGVSTLLLVADRLIIRSFIRKLRRRNFLVEKVFVVGEAEPIQIYVSAVGYTPVTGLKIAEVFVDSHELSRLPSALDFAALTGRIQRDIPDVVVLAFNNSSNEFVANFIRSNFDGLTKIQVMAPQNQALLGMSTDSINGVHLMTLNEPAFSLPELTAKRIVDIIGSFAGLLLVSPLMLVLGILVKMSSKGPVFFGQERVGLDGTTFMMWKFRTMKVGTVEDTKGWTVENDPRRTAIGTFIRKTSLDELPQLWNVLVGNMSLVGPRPEQTHFVEKFRREIPAYMLRHKMRAGITGWAQVNGWRGDTSLHKRIEYDLYYIRNWTLWFDIKILMLTVVRGFINKNAY
jgi:Undecaprenyl-phosphate glucose phosphotransferase